MIINTLVFIANLVNQCIADFIHFSTHQSATSLSVLYRPPLSRDISGNIQWRKSTCERGWGLSYNSRGKGGAIFSLTNNTYGNYQRRGGSAIAP